MRTWVIECWDGVMNQWYNPLKYIPDLQVRHMVLQILAWLWCIAFSLYFASWFLFGVTVYYRDAKTGMPYKVPLPKNDPGGEHD